MDEGPSTDTMRSSHICDNENSLFVNEGFKWARLTGPRNRVRNLCIILVLCLSCLVVVTAMAISAYSQIANTQKLNADSLKALKAPLLSELQDVKPNVTRVTDNVQKLEESLSTVRQTLQKYDSQIANTQKLNADSLKALKALLLSEFQDVKPNVKRVSDKVQKLEESLSTVRQTLQKCAMHLCPEHWILFAGKCYFFSKSKDNFENARTACQSSQANLVVINDKTEQDFLANRAASQFYWIGLTDLITEGVWRWEDGTSYSSTPNFWIPGQPDNYQIGEHCAQLHIKGLWNDEYCSNKFKYICEEVPN